MGDRVVPVDAQRHQHVRGAVRDDHLEKSDDLARKQSRLPGHRQLPHDIRGDGEQADAEISGSEMHDEEVHPGPPRPGGEQGGEDEGVAGDDDGEENPEEGQLLHLQSSSTLN